MQEDIKPIKRSPQLVPLSREHHDVLLFVWKIRQGIRMEVQPERIVAFVQWFWQGVLEAHLGKEEMVLLPHMKDHPALCNRILEEHKQIRDNIDVVLHNSYWETLENLAHTVMQHVRFEERIFLAELEKRVSNENLELIGMQLAGIKNDGVWEDAFWESA